MPYLMRIMKFGWFTLLPILVSCGKDQVGYFQCTIYGLEQPYYSLVIDSRKKTMLFMNETERTYEVSGSNSLVSRVRDDNGATRTLEFDRITGQFSVLYDYINSAGNPDRIIPRYQCKRTQRLI